MPHHPFVTVLVPAHNEGPFIKACINSILGTGWPTSRLEIIVVDNNSTDETAKIATDNGAIIIRQNEGRIGKIRNAGLARACGDYVAYVDADCTVPSTWLSTAINELQRNPRVGAVGGPCMAPQSGTWVERGLGTTSLDQQAQFVRSLATSSFIASRQLLNDVGKFNEELRSGEDSELSQRLVERGFLLVSHPDSHVIHYGYPRSLLELYRKQIWHGSNQLEASSGLSFTLALSHLMLIASLGLIATLLVSAFMRGATIYIATAALCGFMAPPIIYSLKRMRTQPASPLQLSRWFFIGLAYFLGRASGLSMNYWRRLSM